MQSVNDFAKLLGDACYVFLTINFLWGLYCVVMGWRQVNRLRFKSRQRQIEFLDELLPLLQSGKNAQAVELCEGDPRALPQLAGIAIIHGEHGFDMARQEVSEVIQHDILGELEYRSGWIATVVKSGPLLGLFGTVLGMMAAFGRIGTGEKVQPSQIADEISIALICTAMGLATAIPFNFMLASITNRMRKLQDSLMGGMTRILEVLKAQSA